MVKIMTTSTIPRLLLLAAGLLVSYALQAQDSPHWTKAGCQACHVDEAPTEGAVNLKAANAEALCESCHNGEKSCRHKSGLPAEDMDIADVLRGSLKEGQVVCSTCHDVVFQCKHSRIQYSYQNPGFLRNRTSRYTSKYCVNCHDSDAYEKLNPHEGIAGMPPKPTCMLCHQNIPETNATGDVNVMFNMQHDLNDTCRGCHQIAPHPTNLFASKPTTEWLHLAMPSAEILANLQEFEAETGMALPLHPDTGEILCSTCHNQHGFMGGSPDTEPKHRLRVNDICQACHDK